MFPSSSNGWPSHPPAAQAPFQQGLSELIQLLQAEDVHRHDVDTILDSADAISLAYPSMASQIVTTRQFDRWARSVESKRLLIEDNHSVNMLEAGDALSWFGALLAKTLRSREEFVSISFFCSRHIERDDNCNGVVSMMRSLVSQLCQQLVDKFSIVAAPLVSVSSQQQPWDLADLLRCFDSLARQLPRQVTLVCILDGVNHYENEDHEDEVLIVLRFLVGLTRDASIPAAIKVLATSATKTVVVHTAFQIDDSSDDDALLSTTELPMVCNDVVESDLDVEWNDRDR